MLLAKAVAGDFQGSVVINTGVLWSGPKADKFRGLSFCKQDSLSSDKYDCDQLVRVVHLAEDATKSFLGSAATGLAGGLLLGPAGLIAGVLVGGKKAKLRLGIELEDGKKVVLIQDSKDKALQCLLLYSKEKGILEQDLGF